MAEATIETQPVPNCCCSPKNRLICILAGLVLIAIFTSVGFLLGKNLSQPKTSPIVQISPTPVLPTPTIDPTANWKTYANEEYGFELKYPEKWSEISSGPNAAMAQLLEGQTISGTVQPSYDTITFLDTNKSEQFNIEIFQPYKYEISPQGYEKGYLYTLGPCDLRWGFTADKVETTNFSNKQFLRVEGTDTVCYYTESKKENLIVFSAMSSTSLKKDLTILDQILSTFRFLE